MKMKIATGCRAAWMAGALAACGTGDHATRPGEEAGSGSGTELGDASSPSFASDAAGTPATSNPTDASSSDGAGLTDGAAASTPCATSVASVFQDTAYGGYQVCLGEGRYDAPALMTLGAKLNDISSLKVQPGYRVTLYSQAGFIGSRLVEEWDAPSLSANYFNDMTSSVVVEKTPLAKHGALHVCGAKLCDPSNAVVRFTGWGWGPVEWYGGTNANQPTASGVQNMIRQFYVTAMRVPTWNQNYQANPADTYAKMDPLVDEAIADGLYVIIDWHNAEGDPLTRMDAAKTFFDRMAAKYAANPNVLYEIFNEPYSTPTDTISWHGNIKPYAEQVIPVIRARAPNAIVIVGTESWSSQPAATIAEPLQYSNVMYTFHFYAKTSTNISDAQNAVDKGFALFFTEWGTTLSSGQGGHDYVESQKWVDFMSNNQQSWTTFNFGTWNPGNADPPNNCSSFFIGADNNGPWTADEITPDAVWKIDRTP